MNLLLNLPFAWLAVAQYAYYAIVAVLAVVSYVSAEKAKKAAQNALNKAKGLLYQSRSTVEPRRLLYGRRRIGGLEAYVTSSGKDNVNIHYILIWCDGPCKKVESILFDGVAVPIDPLTGIATGKYVGRVKVEHRLGGTDNDTYIPNIPGWGPTDMLLGICFSAVTLIYDEKVFATGVPNMSAVIQGRLDIYDERDATLKFTDNPALCLNHYLTSARTGPGIDYATRVSVPEFIDAANICDELVALSGTGDSSSSGALHQRRYTFNDIITLDMDPEVIIEGFRTAFSGVSVYIGGKWRYYVGAYITPTFTITKDMLTGPVQFRTKISKSDHINTIKGTYVAECNNWQPTSFPPVSNPAYVTEDGEELLENLDFTSKNTMMEARRLAKIDLIRGRLSRSVDIQMHIEGLRAQPGLPVIFDFPELFFFAQPMMVLEYGMSISEDVVTISMNLREYGPEIFAWTAAEDMESTNCNGPTISAPGFPGDKPGGPGSTYPSRFPPGVLFPPSASFTVECKYQGGTASLVGDPEYTNGTTILPSVPPKKYRHQTFSGHYRFEIGYLSCVCQSFDDALISGSKQYDATTGALSSTAQWIHDFGNTGCASDPTYPRTGAIGDLGDVAWGTEDHQYCIIVESTTKQKTTFGKPGCTPWTCEICHTDFFSNPFYCKTSGTNGSAALSQEDTDEDAFARLKATFADWATISPSTADLCFAQWQERTSGFSFQYTEAQIHITGGGYFPAYTYTLTFDIMRRSFGVGAFTKVGTIDVELSPGVGGSLDQTIDIPNDKGFETYLAGGTLS